MNRNEFRSGVFKRDDHACINCQKEAVDAHHIMERRLFNDGGYDLSNGASLCENCHILAEQTILSTDDLRGKLGIKKAYLPEHLYSDNDYDKWGNIINADGTRIKGELFYDISVQKILPQHIKDLFIEYIKYPRTLHVPWTESTTTDDKILDNMNHFVGKEVVVTEKRDGENSSVYWDGYFHARSVSGNSHPSQGWLKNNIQSWYFELPKGWRVCGENLYATHSLEYSELDTYFEVFGIWNDQNLCLDWDSTVEWCQMLGLTHVPVLYHGAYSESEIRNLKLNTEHQEGYVIRLVDQFPYGAFRNSLAKFVRKDHVQETVHNWRSNWDPRKINKLTK